MLKSKKWLLGALFGVIPAALLLLAAEHTLRSLGDLVLSVGAAFDLSASDVEMYSDIVGQLRDAVIRTPILPVILLCCAAAALTAKWLLKTGNRKPRIVLSVLLWILFLLVMFLFTLAFTEVNTILFGLLLRSAAALL